MLLAICILILLLTIFGVIYKISFPHLKDLHKIFRYLLYLPISFYCFGVVVNERSGVAEVVGFVAVLVVLAGFLVMTSQYFLD